MFDTNVMLFVGNEQILNIRCRQMSSDVDVNDMGDAKGMIGVIIGMCLERNLFVNWTLGEKIGVLLMGYLFGKHYFYAETMEKECAAVDDGC